MLDTIIILIVAAVLTRYVRKLIDHICDNFYS